MFLSPSRGVSDEPSGDDLIKSFLILIRLEARNFGDKLIIFSLSAIDIKVAVADLANHNPRSKDNLAEDGLLSDRLRIFVTFMVMVHHGCILNRNFYCKTVFGKPFIDFESS